MGRLERAIAGAGNAAFQVGGAGVASTLDEQRQKSITLFANQLAGQNEAAAREHQVGMEMFRQGVQSNENAAERIFRAASQRETLGAEAKEGELDRQSRERIARIGAETRTDKDRYEFKDMKDEAGTVVGQMRIDKLSDRVDVLRDGKWIPASEDPERPITANEREYALTQIQKKGFFGGDTFTIDSPEVDAQVKKNRLSERGGSSVPGEKRDYSSLWKAPEAATGAEASPEIPSAPEVQPQSREDIVSRLRGLVVNNTAASRQSNADYMANTPAAVRIYHRYLINGEEPPPGVITRAMPNLTPAEKALAAQLLSK